MVWRIVVNAARDAGRRGRRKLAAPSPVETRADELGLPLELLTDGTATTLPVVDGLFLGALHQSLHWRLRPRLVSVIARNSHGHVVGFLKLASR
ncbi:MAG TPA: hypothetical protein VFU30_06110 [Gaiellaceae bacterium]|nr:hypothetical protein [Gaiellaceae bacterium]